MLCKRWSSCLGVLLLNSPELLTLFTFYVILCYLDHIASDTPVSCSFVSLSIVECEAFVMLSDVLSAPWFLVVVFFFVVRDEFQAAVRSRSEGVSVENLPSHSC